MGQAKNRKSEIQALKANNAKNIQPFIIRGSIVDGLAVYDTSSLTPAQANFVKGCVLSINETMLQNLENRVVTEETYVTFVSWINSEDFIGTLAGPFKPGTTPDSYYAEALKTFQKSQSDYPLVGFTYTRDEIVSLGTEQSGFMFDLLAEGGTWPWINARAVFQKQGDLLVVIDTM